jgi:hypothetical protein
MQNIQDKILLAQVDTNINNYIAPKTEGADGVADTIVKCGNDSDVKNACTIDDLFSLATNVGDYVITVVFPAVFFIGLLFTVYPILKDPTNPTNIAEAKSRLWKLLIGSGFMLGAYLLVKAVLVGIGLNTDGVFKKVVSFLNEGPITTAYAQSFTNPLQSVSVQSVILGVVNVFTFLAVIGIILGIIRGVIFLMLGQENPEYIKKGKTWIIYTLLVAAVVFGSQMIFNVITDTVKGVFV